MLYNIFCNSNLVGYFHHLQLQGYSQYLLGRIITFLYFLFQPLNIIVINLNLIIQYITGYFSSNLPRFETGTARQILAKLATTDNSKFFSIRSIRKFQKYVLHTSILTQLLVPQNRLSISNPDCFCCFLNEFVLQDDVQLI